jgi:hypothetical protein
MRNKRVWLVIGVIFGLLAFASVMKVKKGNHKSTKGSNARKI